MVGVCVWMPAVHLEPGEVIVRGAPTSGMLHLGSVPPGRDADLLAAVSADLVAATFDAPRPADVMPWKYRKLLSNLGNALQALVGPAGGTRALAEQLDAEARAVLDAAHIDVTPDAEEAAARAAGFTMHPVPGVPDDVGGSTWQSLQRGTGNVETDYLNGEIARIAHGLGRQAPLQRAPRLPRAPGRRPGSAAGRGHRPPGRGGAGAVALRRASEAGLSRRAPARRAAGPARRTSPRRRWSRR